MLAVNHDVEDYDRWKAAFDEHPPAKGGAAFHRVNRNVDSANNVTVVAAFPTEESARAFVSDPALRDAMQRAGVKGPPRIELYEVVEAVEY
ncbi:MAG: hypothetical protein ACRD6W_16595 [Nitrososphaerales archaeon]